MNSVLCKWLIGFVSVVFLLASEVAAGAAPDSLPSKRTVRTDDGLDIFCESSGQGDTALVFLHGWGGDRHYWKNQVGWFSARYRVVTIDQAGYGESGKDRQHWTVARLGEDVVAVVSALDLKRVILIGHSMGGPVSLVAAKKMPGQVVAVIGVDTLQNVEFKRSEQDLKGLFDGLRTDFAGTVRATFAGLLPEKVDPDLIQWLTSKAVTQDPKVALSLFHDVTVLDTKTLMQDSKVPVRCINSAGGYPYFIPTAVQVNRQYADYNAILIDNVGHYPMLEKPDQFNRQLQETLREFATTK